MPWLSCGLYDILGRGDLPSSSPVALILNFYTHLTSLQVNQASHSLL